MIKKNGVAYTIFETEAGWIGLVSSSRGISRITLPQKSRTLAEASLGEIPGEAVCSDEFFQELIKKFEAYFQGDKVVFSEQLDMSDATPFEQSVWECTKSIPFGETRSYGWVARQIGKPQAPRAVGQALGRNPLPIIIPCHRVLASDGKLRGFGGGLELKQYLLDLETRAHPSKKPAPAKL